SGFNPPGAVLSSPSSLSLNTNSGVSVTARGTQAGGAAVPDGTNISVSVSPASAGNIATVGGEASNGSSATGGSVGGNVTFYFQSGGQPGPATLSFSMTDPSTPGRTITTSTQVTIGSGPGSDPRIRFQATEATLPANPYFETSYVPFIGSPYISEITITARSASGQPFSGEDAEIVASIAPVEVAAFS